MSASTAPSSTSDARASRSGLGSERAALLAMTTAARPPGASCSAAYRIQERFALLEAGASIDWELGPSRFMELDLDMLKGGLVVMTSKGASEARGGLAARCSAAPEIPCRRRRILDRVRLYAFCEIP